MTHIETARFNEAIGLLIGTLQETARRLNVGSTIEELEADIGLIEDTIAELRANLKSVPHGSHRA